MASRGAWIHAFSASSLWLDYSGLMAVGADRPGMVPDLGFTQ